LEEGEHGERDRVKRVEAREGDEHGECDFACYAVVFFATVFEREPLCGVPDDEDGDERVLKGEEEVFAVSGEREVVAVGVEEGDGVGEGLE
jgi:hypothetical protein